MSFAERENPQERQEKRKTALAGLFRAYTYNLGAPYIHHAELKLNSGEKREFMVFGALPDEEDRPEILVVISADTNIRAVAKATWRDQWPEVEGVDSLEGLRTISGTVQTVGESSIGVSDTRTLYQELELDEFLDIINKLAFSLTFPPKALQES